VVSEEAETWLRAREQVVEAGGITDKAVASAVAREPNSRGSIVSLDDIESDTRAQHLDLVSRVVALSVALQLARKPAEIGRSITPTHAPDRQDLGSCHDPESLAVRKIVQACKDLAGWLGIEPPEILVVALDEDGGAWDGPPLSDPPWEIAGTVMTTSGGVDMFRIGPHPEVADMENPIERHAEGLLEGEDVSVEAIESAVYIAGRAKDHDVIWTDKNGGPPRNLTASDGRYYPFQSLHVTVQGGRRDQKTSVNPDISGACTDSRALAAAS